MYNSITLKKLLCNWMGKNCYCCWRWTVKYIFCYKMKTLTARLHFLFITELLPTTVSNFLDLFLLHQERFYCFFLPSCGLQQFLYIIWKVNNFYIFEHRFYILVYFFSHMFNFLRTFFINTLKIFLAKKEIHDSVTFH